MIRCRQIVFEVRKTVQVCSTGKFALTAIPVAGNPFGEITIGSLHSNPEIPIDYLPTSILFKIFNEIIEVLCNYSTTIEMVQDEGTRIKNLRWDPPGIAPIASLDPEAEAVPLLACSEIEKDLE
jgi:hypothetical protein